jgi:uncharacterized membrane protein YkoI
MHSLKKLILGFAALVALGMGGAALAGATSGGNDHGAPARSEAADDGENSARLGPDLRARLKAAALARTRGGTVGAMERDTEKGATYEVEVKRPDGSQVDVRLDDQLDLVVIDADGER